MNNPRDYSSRAREEAVPYDRSLTVAAPNFAISQRLYRGRLAPTNHDEKLRLRRLADGSGCVISPRLPFERDGDSIPLMICDLAAMTMQVDSFWRN